MSKKILANDGIDALGKLKLEEAGFTVETNKVVQTHLAEEINKHQYDVLIVRSATQVRKSLIEACPSLKLIARAGVGLDNIDVEFAESKNIKVINTPASSSQSVAELVFAHLFSGARFLQQSNHDMRHGGENKFNELKKAYAAGIELKDKTLGIVGFGRIGQAVARMAVGLGMKVLAYDPFIKKATIQLSIIQTAQELDVEIETTTLDQVLQYSDFLTLHVPGLADGKPLIGLAEMKKMKVGAAIVNASRGGVVDEADLQIMLAKKHLRFAGLDVFLNEPHPDPALLHSESISVSPHIGASTLEAQERIGKELAQSIIDCFI